MKQSSHWQEKVLWWGGFFALILAFLVLVQNILFPFVVSLLLAYLFNPMMESLRKRNVPRAMAALLMVLAFYLIAILLSALLVPVLYQQTLLFLEHAPDYIRRLQEELLPLIKETVGALDPQAVDKIQNASASLSAAAFKVTLTFIKNIWQSGVAVINVLSLFFITPIVTFYMLRDWQSFVKKVVSWFPKRHAKVIKQQITLIDQTLSGYLRGQLNVVLLLATYYALALSAADLRFGLIIGFATGILSFIPFLGVLAGFITGTIMAYVQFGTLTHVLIVAAIFIVGQVVEGNFVTPKLVGDRVNLHPVWIIFGMLAGGTLFGFTGILLAVPVTAIVGVLVRFIMDQYLNSKLYTD